MRVLSTGVLLMVLACVSVADDHYSKSHRQVAGDLLILSGAEQNAIAGATVMADVMLKSNPLLVPYRDVLISWSTQVMSWENMKPLMVDLYVEIYTEEELRELVEFYKTPVGKKTVRVTPELVRRGAMIGGELAAEHTDELQEMIQQRSAELGQFVPVK